MTAPLNWRKHLPIHPAAELFPLMAEAELQTLADDIKANGLNYPIVVLGPDPNILGDTDTQLIDGRNRLDAMALAGLLKVDDQGKFYPPGGARLVHGDPYDIVLSLNIHRRHLTPEQKRELIAKLIKANPEKSNRQIADQVKVSHPHIAKVRAELEKTGDVETVSTSIDTKGRKQPAKRKKTAEDHSAATDMICTRGDDGADVWSAPQAEVSIEQRKAEMAQLATAPDDLVDQAIRLVEQMTADQRRGFIGRLWEKGLLTEFTPPGDDSIPEFLLRAPS